MSARPRRPERPDATSGESPTDLTPEEAADLLNLGREMKRLRRDGLLVEGRVFWRNNHLSFSTWRPCTTS